MNNFKRGKDPKVAMDIGGYSFDTLKVGAILKAKKYFGITWSGKFRGYQKAGITVNIDSYFLIIDVSNIITQKGRKLIRFTKYRNNCLSWALEDKEQLFSDGKITKKKITQGYMNTSKIQFDNRLEVIER